MTPDKALELLKAAFPADAMHVTDDEEIETYVYGPDDPDDYFAKVADEGELKADFAEFLKG